MATVAQARAAIIAPLNGIGLNGDGYWSSQPNCPAALLKPSESGPLQTLGNPKEETWELAIVANSLQNGERTGQEILDPYLEDTGDLSIEQLLKGADLANGVQVVDLSWANYGSILLSDIPYIGVIFTLKVWR